MRLGTKQKITWIFMILKRKLRKSSWVLTGDLRLLDLPLILRTRLSRSYFENPYTIDESYQFFDSNLDTLTEQNVIFEHNFLVYNLFTSSP